MFQDVRVKIRNSGGGNGIGGGHSMLRWAVAGGHDSALIATWITPCICYQACNCNAIIAMTAVEFLHLLKLRVVDVIALASEKNLWDFSI